VVVRVASLALLAGCSFSALPSVGAAADAQPDAPADAALPPDFHLRVGGLIDGESHLIIKGTTVHWQHYTFAAPGRWSFAIDPITLDGTGWYPTWPDVPNTENRDCNGCQSSSTELPIGVPRAPSTTSWTEVQTRRAQGIVQYPSAANDYELIVLISDQGVGGAAQYVVDVDVKVNR